jgi:hypothetical protein
MNAVAPDTLSPDTVSPGALSPSMLSPAAEQAVALTDLETWLREHKFIDPNVADIIAAADKIEDLASASPQELEKLTINWKILTRKRFLKACSKLLDLSSSKDDCAKIARLEKTLFALTDTLECPVSLELMRNPVFASDGHTYEREMIENWIEEDNETSPLTGEPLTSLMLTPNYLALSIISKINEIQY